MTGKRGRSIICGGPPFAQGALRPLAATHVDAAQSREKKAISVDSLRYADSIVVSRHWGYSNSDSLEVGLAMRRVRVCRLHETHDEE
jgi:hypothetical protein